MLQKVKGGCEWAVRAKLFTDNPYEEVTPTKHKSSNEIDPFTQPERDLIIEAFENSRYYSYYSSFIKFMFFTGCRPPDAIALTWGKVTAGEFIFDCDYVEGKLQERTKTEKRRKISLNSQIKNILLTAKTCNLDLVFSNKSGGYLDLHNISNRAWKKILLSTSTRHRPLYNCRHTFITLCLNQGTPVAQVAA